MFTTVTCVYTINPTGQLGAPQTAAAMSSSNVPIPPEFLALTGATVTSDTTSSAGGTASRTVVFNIASAQFQAQFPSDVVSPFRGLLTLPIGKYVNAVVVESLPVAA